MHILLVDVSALFDEHLGVFQVSVQNQLDEAVAAEEGVGRDHVVVHEVRGGRGGGEATAGGSVAAAAAAAAAGQAAEDQACTVIEVWNFWNGLTVFFHVSAFLPL